MIKKTNIEGIKLIFSDILTRIPSPVLRNKSPELYVWSDDDYIEVYTNNPGGLKDNTVICDKIRRQLSLKIWMRNGKTETLRNIKKRIKSLFIETWEKIC